VPFVAEGKLDVAIVSAGGAGAAMVIDSWTDFACAGFPASVSVMVGVLVPVAVGVPETRPVVDARERPAGRLPEVTDQV
jgi:hypothetical protein